MCYETSFLASNKHIGFLFRHPTLFGDNSHTAIAKALGISASLEDGFAKIEVRQYPDRVTCILDEKTCPTWYNSSFQRSVSKYGKMLREVRAAIKEHLNGNCELICTKSDGVCFNVRRPLGYKMSKFPLKYFTSAEALSLELKKRTDGSIFFPTDWCQKLISTPPSALFGKISYADIEAAHTVWCPKS